MSPSSWQEWVAWAGVVLPLMTLAGSAVGYIFLAQQKNAEEKFNRFFDLMEKIGAQDYSIAAKMAAISELRKFPEHKEVVIRLCQDAQVGGPQAFLLEREFDLTARHFGSRREGK
jgi:hypothetical protein